MDGSNNTNYGSYTTYTSTDVDNSVYPPTNKSYHVGKSKSNVFNIVNQDNIGVYMNTGDTSFTSTSDERLKHNIQDTKDSLEKICALQPRKFKWKYNDKPESGFIAQEIERYSQRWLTKTLYLMVKLLKVSIILLYYLIF